MSERLFEVDLRHLKESLVTMGGRVEKSIEIAVGALTTIDAESLTEVFKIEQEVNQSHLSIDEECLNLLALRQPLASDLRLIMAAVKINGDLERMGDQAVNIAKNVQMYLKTPGVSVPQEVQDIAVQAQKMVRESLNAFVGSSEHKAKSVLTMDDRADDLKNSIFRILLEHMKKNPNDVEQCLNLILIARNLERVADHATNIAEEIVFSCTGKDIRHPRRFENRSDSRSDKP